jgi:tetratricopeptide (TPR) repeat protein
MNDLVLREIAHEIKGLHNGALAHIKKGEYVEAAVQYRKALMITEKISYYEGMAITLYSMANLALVIGDIIEALNNAADARNMFVKANLPHEHCSDLLRQLAGMAKKQGIKYEREGKFQEAINHFEAALPFVDEKSCKALVHEIELLRRILNDR